MGCTSSSPESVIEKAAHNGITPDGPVRESEKKTRELEATAGTETTTVDASASDSTAGGAFKASCSSSVRVGDLSIRYASLCRRGRDPDAPDKPNQDCYGVHHNEGGSSSSAFFAVYDGHGPAGDRCSHFVRARLPVLLRRNIEQKLRHGDGEAGGQLPVENIHDSLHDAHIEVNGELRHSEIDDRFSGTTSVGVYARDGRITISNVGDSRVVLGTTDNGASAIQAVPLSKDHTPHRADEAARCKASGARILSFGQIDPSTAEDDDDDVEDPPRVWAMDGRYPGTAFTRSVGDSVAEGLGVCAEPEMLTLPISPDERLLVLASDGVFDVVSNQEVVDLCFAHRSDPAGACEAVVGKSHAEWLLNDDCLEDEANYDDMTCVVVFFDHPEREGSGALPPQASSPQPQQEQPLRQGKRVRQKTLQNLEAMV